MATRAEIIAAFKSDYPTIRVGDEKRGYTNLNAAEYEATINKWADNSVAQEAVTASDTALEALKVRTIAKLMAPVREPLLADEAAMAVRGLGK